MSDIFVGTHPNGAPYVAVTGQRVPWSISITHSHDRGVCVLVPAGVLVGCDLERVETRSDEFVREWFTHAEQKAIEHCDPLQRDRLTTLFWSAKESALKALGLGLTVSTHMVTVSADGGGESAGWNALDVRRHDNPEPMLGWWRSDGRDLITVVTVPALAQPIALNRFVRSQ